VKGTIYGTFVCPPNLSDIYYTNIQSKGVVKGDFNGDFKIDVASSTNNGHILFLINNGNGTFR